jgi:hypothetical protein
VGCSVGACVGSGVAAAASVGAGVGLAVGAVVGAVVAAFVAEDVGTAVALLRPSGDGLLSTTVAGWMQPTSVAVAKSTVPMRARLSAIKSSLPFLKRNAGTGRNCMESPPRARVRRAMVTPN